MGLPVAQIPWGRANQFCDLMRVLELRTIHFDQRSAIAEQNLRSGLDNARFAGAGWSQKQKVSDGTTWRMKPSTKHLIQLDKRFDGFVLPDDFLPQRIFKMS